MASHAERQGSCQQFRIRSASVSLMLTGPERAPIARVSTLAFRRLTPVTEWARQHRKRVFLGEIGVGSGRTCLDALDRVIAL